MQTGFSDDFCWRFKEQSDLDPHCFSLYLTLLNDVSKNLQQTTNADDGIFR